jgi:hypothetical protein
MLDDGGRLFTEFFLNLSNQILNSLWRVFFKSFSRGSDSIPTRSRIYNGWMKDEIMQKILKT